VGADGTWVNSNSILGGDFLANYRAARAWLAGINPYLEPFGDPAPYLYAPILFRLFAWCHFFDARSAVFLWMVALVAMSSFGAVASWRARRALALSAVPLPFVLGAVLCSFPITFALERGNCDLLVLLLLVPAACALRQRSAWRDVVAGACLGLAPWIKVYAAFLVLSLPALRRWRALAFFALCFAAIWLIDIEGVHQFRRNVREYVKFYNIGFAYGGHMFTTWWGPLWRDTPLDWLGQLPGIIGAAAALFPLAFWVSLRVRWCSDPSVLIYPYLLWLTALATFLAPVSSDYNLFFLPLASLALWDRRDSPFVHALMMLMVLWWQPLRLEIGPRLFFLFKLAGLLAVALSLLARCREQNEQAVVEKRQDSERIPAPSRGRVRRSLETSLTALAVRRASATLMAHASAGQGTVPGRRARCVEERTLPKRR
jgi:hypothetical protein